ncbi:putative ERG2/sigma1 receptor [Rosa chinensis]|uniref:Putative ERG2/sigma1 receptor n=1 Tax=Rosa chinensis TaxID=74649 RepID=A0A2P6QWP2_ROSCH|nr:uncharacterized protein LOC112196320 [Rosa chinensis]PRQ38605.1 putative ERG2/sigma1 receptor [Rosa chinensis]
MTISNNKQTISPKPQRTQFATMKKTVTTPTTASSASSSSSSVKSSTTGPPMEEDRSESCYYPGCRKDANCNCDMCLASINATLDLMPFSVQKSSMTKFSSSRPDRPNSSVEQTPISFDASVLSTPISTSPRFQASPDLKPSARLDFEQSVVEKEEGRKWGFGWDCWKLVLGLSLVYVVVYGFYSNLASGVLKPVLSPEIVRNAGEKSWVVQDLNGRLRFLQKEMQGLVPGKVSNCSYPNSLWEITQDGLLLSSHCKLFKSAIEEVSIWGWPLQTAGLLTTGFSSRSYTILSGRVTEWSDGKVGYVIRKENSSWVQRNWGASAVQLDPNTWLLEYRRSSVSHNQRLVSAVLSFLKYKLSRALGKIKQKFWLPSTFGNNQYYEVTAEYNIKIPT